MAGDPALCRGDAGTDGGGGFGIANFREFDVEGYRIYRGRVASQLVLVAEYDYAGTVFTDNWGGFAYDGNCAPELGITTDCPTFPNDVPLIDDVAQVKAGSRTELADGSVFYKDQRLDREQALRSYTLNNAYAAFEEELKGSLTVGKLADIVVLHRDIMSVPEE